ncbi:MAG: Fe(3+) ABC transporter substrate-binding protein [Planctomycetota bacterium]
MAIVRFLSVLSLLGFAVLASARAEEVVNVYSARHYDTDDQIYQKFTEQTGIKVNLIEGNSDALLQRLDREGDRSPADIFITVDAGRLYQAEKQKVFQPIKSDVLEKRIPANLRHPDGLWFGLTKRARIILRSKERTSEGDITSYEDLADPKWKGRVLIRSSSNVYNQSLVGSIIEAKGEAGALEWCKGVVANMARKPQGGDITQIQAVAAGEGDVAVSNSYYFGRMLKGTPEQKAAAASVAIVFPNQDGRGTHVNLSGVGVVASAPNKANAVKFLEFLAGDFAQEAFAAGNNEFPVVPGVARSAVVKSFGEFKEDQLNAAVFGNNNQKAVRIMDQAGWR